MMEFIKERARINHCKYPIYVQKLNASVDCNRRNYLLITIMYKLYYYACVCLFVSVSITSILIISSKFHSFSTPTRGERAQQCMWEASLADNENVYLKLNANNAQRLIKNRPFSRSIGLSVFLACSPRLNYSALKIMSKRLTISSHFDASEWFNLLPSL